jgi:hypothetical protein
MKQRVEKTNVPLTPQSQRRSACIRRALAAPEAVDVSRIVEAINRSSDGVEAKGATVVVEASLEITGRREDFLVSLRSEHQRCVELRQEVRSLLSHLEQEEARLSGEIETWEQRVAADDGRSPGLVAQILEVSHEAPRNSPSY